MCARCHAVRPKQHGMHTCTKEDLAAAAAARAATPALPKQNIVHSIFQIGARTAPGATARPAPVPVPAPASAAQKVPAQLPRAPSRWDQPHGRDKTGPEGR